MTNFFVSHDSHVVNSTSFTMEGSSQPPTTSSSHEQFCLLAKNTKGIAAVQLVKQVLEAPNVYVFGEILDEPNIQAMDQSEGEEGAGYLALLQIFAYSTYGNYLETRGAAKLPPLTEAMTKKLRLLTIATLATKTK